MGGNPALQSAMSVVSIAIVAGVLFVQKRVVERKVYTMTQGRARRRGACARAPRCCSPPPWAWCCWPRCCR
jgi:iron(III) transport system permease protein